MCLRNARIFSSSFGVTQNDTVRFPVSGLPAPSLRPPQLIPIASCVSWFHISFIKIRLLYHAVKTFLINALLEIWNSPIVDFLRSWLRCIHLRSWAFLVVYPVSFEMRAVAIPFVTLVSADFRYPWMPQRSGTWLLNVPVFGCVLSMPPWSCIRLGVYANAMRMHYQRNTNVVRTNNGRNTSKVKESKGK